MKTKKARRRRKYLVSKAVQFRYMRLVIIPLIVLLTALYCFIYYCVFRQMLIPEAVATTLLPATTRTSVSLWVMPSSPPPQACSTKRTVATYSASCSGVNDIA